MASFVQLRPPSSEANASPGDVELPATDVAPTEMQKVLTQDTDAPTSDKPCVQVAPPSEVTRGNAMPYVFVASLPASPTHDSELTHEIVANPAGPAATVAADQVSPPSWLTALIEGEDTPGPGPAPPMRQNEVLGHVTEIVEASPAGDASTVQLAPPSEVRATADPTATQKLDGPHATSPTEPTAEGRVVEAQCCPPSVVTTANGVAEAFP
jgi:hypothetical protein